MSQTCTDPMPGKVHRLMAKGPCSSKKTSPIWLLHVHASTAEEVDSGQDSDFLKEFVVSPDDLTAEAVLGDVLGTDQQQSKMSSKTKQAQPCSPVLERPCMTNSTDSEPPLSPSIDGSQTSASPGSSFTFAGWDLAAKGTPPNFPSTHLPTYSAEDVTDDAQSFSRKPSERSPKSSQLQRTLPAVQHDANRCTPSASVISLPNTAHITADLPRSQSHALEGEVSHNSIQHRTPTLMLQLESEQDSEQLHTETKSDIPSRCAAASNSAPLQAIAQQPADMAQCSDSAPCDLLQLSNASPAASAADDASRSAQPGWQGVHLLHHNRFATPISKLANMLQHQHGKHAQLLPMTGSNAYSHPNDAPNIQQPAHQAGMPASLQHILPQHLTRLQLQNLHRAAEILSSPVQGRASIRQESSPKDKVSAEAGAAAVGAAEAAAKATIANKSEQALTTAVGCDTQHDPAADAAGHAIPSHQAVHELATCGASRDAFQTACSPRQCSVLRLQSPAVHCDQDDPQDAIAALLDSKLDRMAPALCCLYIDTLCVRHPSTHAAEASQRCSSNPPKRSFSAMQVTAASLPQAEAALTSRPETIDTKVPGHVHGKCECCANSGALVAPSTEEVRTCVQRKRFRKTTGLEVLYRTRPLVCAQLYPIGIPS